MREGRAREKEEGKTVVFISTLSLPLPSFVKLRKGGLVKKRASFSSFFLLAKAVKKQQRIVKTTQFAAAIKVRIRITLLSLRRREKEKKSFLFKVGSAPPKASLEMQRVDFTLIRAMKLTHSGRRSFVFEKVFSLVGRKKISGICKSAEIQTNTESVMLAFY